MASFKIDGKTVFISGDLSINEGESLYNFLRDFPFSSEDVNVDLNRVSSWDTSSLQTFISWMKSTQMKIVWKNIPEEFMNDLKLSGLSGYFKGVKQ
ncbi:MAG TPA: STAS domain-containing protein [bacterium]|nr:STAS domain-containing protein [bacterium]HPS29648.1 STAS domain-containing protein [bacterium]